MDTITSEVTPLRQRMLVLAQLAYRFGRSTENQKVVGKLFALRDHRTGCYEATPADDGAVHDYGLDTDQGAVTHGAAVEHRLVADRDAVADH